MADIPRPKKGKPINTDGEETVVLKVDPAQYRKKNLDNENTAKLSARQINREAQNRYRQNRNTSSFEKKNFENDFPQKRYNNRSYQNDYEYESAPDPAYNYKFNSQYNNSGHSQNSQKRSAPQSRKPQQQKTSSSSQQRRPSQSRQTVSRSSNQTSRQPKKSSGKKQTKKKQGLVTKILKFILIAVVIIFIIYTLLTLLCIFRIHKTQDKERSRTAGAMSSTSVTNVLLIGTDSRDTDEERGRSDSMILVSLNSSSHMLYMTSFMRDSYVSIPGYGSGKLNAAYSYGGPELLMDTIESNFNIAVDSYVSVSFKGFASIIDSVGGVDVTLSDEEAEALNIILQSEVNEIMGDDRDDDLLSGGGAYKLNGKQALSYSRIRYVGNADFERTERQREVMSQVFSKIKTMNPVYIASLLTNAVPNVSTNMSSSNMYLLSLRLPTLLIYKSEQQRIPADGTYQSADIGGESVLQIDFDANIELLESTVFES